MTVYRFDKDPFLYDARLRPLSLADFDAAVKAKSEGSLVVVRIPRKEDIEK